MMKWMRATVNAVLVATLMKPMLRWSIGRWRRQANEYARSTIVIPVHKLLEAAIPAQLVATEARLESTSEEADTVAGRDMLRTVLVVGSVAVVVAVSVSVIAAVVRRRRTPVTPVPKAAIEPVAVPVEVSTAGPEEADSPETPREGPSTSQESHSIGSAVG